MLPSQAASVHLRQDSLLGWGADDPGAAEACPIGQYRSDRPPYERHRSPDTRDRYARAGETKMARAHLRLALRIQSDFDGADAARRTLADLPPDPPVKPASQPH